MYFQSVSAAAPPQESGVPQVLMQWPAPLRVGQPQQQSFLVMPSQTPAGVVLCPASHCLGQFDVDRCTRRQPAQPQSYLPEPHLHQFSNIFPEWEVDEIDFEDACTRMRDGARRAGFSANRVRRRTAEQSVQCSLQDEKKPEPETNDTHRVDRVVGDINISGVVQLGQSGDKSITHASSGDHVDDAYFDRYSVVHRPVRVCGPSQPRQDSWSRYDLELKRFQKWRQEQQRPPLGRIPKHRIAFTQRSVSGNPASAVMQARIRRVYDHAHHTPLNPDDSYLYKFLDDRRTRHADAFSGVNTSSGRRRYDRPVPQEPYIPYDPNALREAGLQTTAPLISVEHFPRQEHRKKTCGAHSDGDADPAGVLDSDLCPDSQPDPFHAGMAFKGKLRKLRRADEGGSPGKPSGKSDGSPEKQHQLSGSLNIVGEDERLSVTGSFTVPLAENGDRSKIREGTPPPWRLKN
ncbi:UNVERIFIED_CONTAM: hypothetical protein HHA_315510 [Hammondia hammondi]|eukprot:XP_008883399.1 hypothetical protein HHA_315510 [Hammondia hammondi]